MSVDPTRKGVTMEVPESWVADVRSRMRELGWNQSELARRCRVPGAKKHVSEATISNVFHRRRGRAITIDEIARVTGIAVPVLKVTHGAQAIIHDLVERLEELGGDETIASVITILQHDVNRRSR